MSYTYSTYRIALQTLVVSQDPDAAFDNILPSAIDYAEQRIYRELDLLQTVQRLYGSATTAANRNLSIDNSFVVVNGINLFSPAGSDEDTGERVPLLPVSRDLLDMIWPGNQTTGEPAQFAMIDQWNAILGPAPDDVYNIEVVGTYRPAALSASNPNTFLTDHLPDLFVAGSMVFMSGYMRNFGQQANDPQMGQSWEQQYQTLKASANAEELRKKFWADSWGSLTPGQGTNTRG